MNCKQARKYLSAFQDNELDVRTNIEVLEHVEMCDECARRLEQHRHLKDAVAHYIESGIAPDGLAGRIGQAISQASGGRGLSWATAREALASGWFRVSAAAASILVVFGLVYGVLLAPPAALNSDAIKAHEALLGDQVPNWMYTPDMQRAQRLAFFRFEKKPSVPFSGSGDLELVGVGPAEIQSRQVGHFCFRYKAVMVSMFVFEGLPLDEVGGSVKDTGIGKAKVYGRGDMNLLAWRNAGFTYVLVGQLPQEDLLNAAGSGLTAE